MDEFKTEEELRQRIADLEQQNADFRQALNEIKETESDLRSSEDLSDLKASEEKFSKVFHATPNPMAISEIESGRYIEVNAAFVQCLGYPRSEIIGKTSLELNLFCDTARWAALVERLGQTGVLQNEEVVICTGSGEKLCSLFSAEFIQLQDRRLLLMAMIDVTMQKQIEQALRESEQKLRLVLQEEWDGFALTDEKGRIVEWNPGNERITGLSQVQVIGVPYWDVQMQLAQPEERTAERADHVRRLVQQALRSGEAPFLNHVLEFDFIRWDGERRVVRQFIYPIQTGRGFCLAGATHDITDLKQAEEALQEARARYYALFEQSHDAVFILNLEGQHIEVNHRAAEMLGYTPDELKALSVRDISAELYRSLNVIDRLVSGEQIPLYERLFRKKNGEVIAVEINVEIVRDGRGEPLHIQSVVRDITERKRVEQQLSENATRYRIVADNTHDWEFWQNPDGQFIYISPSCKRITGREAHEFVRDPDLLRRIVYSDDLAAFDIHHRQVLEMEDSGECEFRIVLPDGSLCWIDHVCQPAFDDQGTYLGVRGSNRDITQRKQMEMELERANGQLRQRVEEVENLQAELREQVMHDSLTGLYNRRYLETTLERELARMKREQKPLAVIILDIDLFKEINDTYGHLVGDRFLVRVAEVLAARTRGSDITCRYGGDEFLLILPGADPAGAYKRAEEIRQACAGLRIPFQNKELSVTISIGVAAYPAHGRQADEFLSKADQALYQSKDMGRNRVTLAA